MESSILVVHRVQEKSDTKLLDGIDDVRKLVKTVETMPTLEIEDVFFSLTNGIMYFIVTSHKEAIRNGFSNQCNLEKLAIEMLLDEKIKELGVRSPIGYYHLTDEQVESVEEIILAEQVTVNGRVMHFPESTDWFGDGDHSTYEELLNELLIHEEDE